MTLKQVQQDKVPSKYVVDRYVYYVGRYFKSLPPLPSQLLNIAKLIKRKILALITSLNLILSRQSLYPTLKKKKKNIKSILTWEFEVKYSLWNLFLRSSIATLGKWYSEWAQVGLGVANSVQFSSVQYVKVSNTHSLFFLVNQQIRKVLQIVPKSREIPRYWKQVPAL